MRRRRSRWDLERIVPAWGRARPIVRPVWYLAWAVAGLLVTIWWLVRYPWHHASQVWLVAAAVAAFSAYELSKDVRRLRRRVLARRRRSEPR